MMEIRNMAGNLNIINGVFLSTAKTIKISDIKKQTKKTGLKAEHTIVRTTIVTIETGKNHF
ncbi:MAG: hypothetical protein QM301_04790 [Bacteroidota bacterium]|nr:hypothetical protein [Bacteroidota bacterium]